jgi:hypothetical protein
MRWLYPAPPPGTGMHSRALTDELLDRIDEIVPPGTDAGAPDQPAYLPPALKRPELRRRTADERAVAA